MKRIVLFDIDGTLLLTGGAGKAAFEQVFLQHFQIADAWRDIHPDGRTDHSLIEELFQKNLGRPPQSSEAAAVRAAYESAMAEALQRAPRFRLMPGVPECLDFLTRAGDCLLGLATGNFEVTAWQKLRRAGLQDFFGFGGFGSDSVDRLELTRVALERGIEKLGARVDPREVTLVGDTIHDIECGKKLGMTVIAVATGSTPVSALAEARPHRVIEHLGDAQAWSEIFA